MVEHREDFAAEVLARRVRGDRESLSVPFVGKADPLLRGTGPRRNRKAQNSEWIAEGCRGYDQGSI